MSNNFASVRDTGESIQGTNMSKKLKYKNYKLTPEEEIKFYWLVRMYSISSRAGAYACASPQARKG